MDQGQKGEHSQAAGKVEKVDSQGRHAHGQFRGAMDQGRKGEHTPTARKIEEVVVLHRHAHSQFSGAMDRGQKGEHSHTAGKVEKVDAQGRHAHGQFRGVQGGHGWKVHAAHPHKLLVRRHRKCRGTSNGEKCEEEAEHCERH